MMSTEPSSPPVNVYEGNGQLSVAAPIPGSHPEHTTVTVTPEAVTIHAQNKYSQESQHYHRHDWKVGSWAVTVPLPQRVDPSRARASLNLGVLVVMAPVSESGTGEAKPPVE